MIIWYDFDEDYEYEAYIGLEEMQKVLKKVDKVEVITVIERLAKKEDVAEFLKKWEITKLEELTKEELVDWCIDLVDAEDFGEYYEDVMYDIFYNKALQEYEDTRYDYWE
jgi:bifunctional DNA-binding transcriptional regulator/antitoxin component of YhaV-PrlF toxin-antitoxin module